MKCIVSAAVLALCVAGPFSASAQAQCLEIDAERGWQSVNLDGSPVEVRSVVGTWTVDDRNYEAVDWRGHIGEARERLARHNRYKFDARFDFGVLLVRDDQGLVPQQRAVPGFATTARKLSFRINDADHALGDNSGWMTVCIRPYSGPGLAARPD